jgi:ABC-type transporter Mla subunit MlaD
VWRNPTVAKSIRNEVKSGILILAALVILGGMVFVVGDFKNLFGKKQTLKVLFASAQGVKVDAPVSYAGVTVGRVAGVRILKGEEPVGAEEKAVEVLLEIDGRINLSNIKEIAIRPKGFLGDTYVDVTPGPAGAKTLPEKTVIHGKEATTLEEIMQNVDEAGKQFLSTLKDINSRIATKEFEDSVRRAVAKAGSAMDRAARALSDEPGGVLETVRKIHRASADLQVLLSEKRDPAIKAVTNARDWSAQVQTKLDTLANGIDRLAKKAEHAIGDKSDNVYTTILKLRTTSENLRVLSTEIKKHPWKLSALFGQSETSSSSPKGVPAKRDEQELRRDGSLGRPAAK